MQASGLLRNVRNVVHNYTEVEIKVREATSNDPWGPSSSIMAEIADLTYNPTAFPEIMGIIWKRLSDTGKNWRHVYKSLVLLDYLVKTGVERVQNQCKENIYSIQTLKDFQYVDSRDYKDHGKNVRERAQQLVGLLKDEERLRSERDKALKNKERFDKQTTAVGSHSAYVTGMGAPKNPGDPTFRPGNTGEEELQLQLALAMSKEEADDKEKRDREDQVRIELAIKESLSNEAAAAAAAAASQGASLGPTTKKPTPPMSAVNDLLNLDFGNETPAQHPASVNVDPWGAPNGGANSPRPFGVTPPTHSDTFGSSTGATPADPFGPADPWGASAPVHAHQQPDPFANAFGGSSGPQTSGVGTFAAPIPIHNDPFASAIPIQSSSPTQASDPFGDPFSSPGNNNTHQSSDIFSLPTDNGTSNAFDMGGMQSSINNTAPAQPQKKSAQTFLGSASGLVNLDALVTRPKQMNMNPFGNTASGSNPFQQNTPGPSMNEMQRNSQQVQMGLQQPMAPSPVGGMNPMMGQPQQQHNQFGAQAMANPWGQSIGGQEEKQTNNPFL